MAMVAANAGGVVVWCGAMVCSAMTMVLDVGCK